MDKLSAKATKCIFLGYSRLQKGYRCYSSETHRYFLSADVTFFEDSPFFSTSESLPISEVLPLPIISPPDAVPSRPLQVIIVVIVSLFLFWPRYLLTHFLSLRLLLPRLCLLLPTYPLLFGKSTPEAIFHPDWRQTMVDEMIALHFNVTWDLVVLPSGKSTVGCRWVYTVKVGPDGQVDRLKGHLVAKGYTQVYGSDYGDTFSPVAKIASVRLLLSMAVMRSWPLYQLDIKNAFLHGDLAEEVYMEQPPGFVAQGESGLTKDLGKLKYFLGIEIAQSSSGVVLSQRKYALDILEETGMLDCKPVDTPMDPNVKLIPGQGEPLRDPGRYRRLVGKLNYLTITCPDISFPSKKQDVVVRSSVEAEYRAMALATCELIWLKHLLRELRFGKDEQMKLICDNQAALHIASNPVFHERTKHIEVDCHFIREKIASGFAKLNTIRVLLSLVVNQDWPLHQLDIKNAFLSGDLEEEVYMAISSVTWRSKKQSIRAQSSAEAKFRVMAHGIYEGMWLKRLLNWVKIPVEDSMKMFYDNQAAIRIAKNLHVKLQCEGDDSEQIRGRETGPTTHSEGKNEKSRGVIATMEARLPKVEIAMVDAQEVQPLSYEEFMSFQDKIMSMLASLESRIETLAT
ncbi:Retrovirus-related Pol polyprotein from transposon RE2 [Vitis vinifera]|uniref:Retrovirus-related Pol polyprotein from transposon RE2 n=1 Tax=Vitis vinifera TaxID=29760 RepID=A0A438HWE9_VITVI|nr:Retrovirus-related Pol polyprotein from transposon RE2 [Vitis vinifera]